MESLRNSPQYQWKLVWRALGQFPNGILKEFLSITMEMGLERILMEFLSKSMETGLESSESIEVNFPMESLRNSFQNHNPGQFANWILEGFLSKSIWNLSGEFLVNLQMEPLRNSFQNQRKLVWRVLGQFTYGILEEFHSKPIRSLSGKFLVNLESSWSIYMWNP